MPLIGTIRSTFDIQISIFLACSSPAWLDVFIVIDSKPKHSKKHLITSHCRHVLGWLGDIKIAYEKNANADKKFSITEKTATMWYGLSVFSSRVKTLPDFTVSFSHFRFLRKTKNCKQKKMFSCSQMESTKLINKIGETLSNCCCVSVKISFKYPAHCEAANQFSNISQSDSISRKV